jgi:hypothetical protein
MLIDSVLMNIKNQTTIFVQVHKHELITGNNYYFIYKNNNTNNNDVLILEAWLIEQCRN